MADDDEKSAAQPFLSRWSQRKQEARDAPPVVQSGTDPDTPAPELPPVDQLTLKSDFSGFLHPKVDANLRRAALTKLFSDPHFNVMDGLDTYVADYSQSAPLPPEMLAGLRQAQNILAWAKETKEETAARFAPAPAAVTATPLAAQTQVPAAVAPAPASEHVETATLPAPSDPLTVTQPPDAARKS